MADEQGVLIIGETGVDGRLLGITGELLAAARELATVLGEGVSAALIGQGVSDLAPQAIELGADTVYTVDGPLFANYLNETYVAAAMAVVRQSNPSIILAGHTPNGRDLGPSLAFRLETGIATDSLRLEIDPDTKAMRAIRSVTGGLFRQVITINKNPQVVTVHMKAYDALGPDSSRQGQVVAVDPGIDASQVKSRFVEHKEAVADGVRLEDARVVVTGGRGLGSVEAFQSLEELATLFGGAVGATRAAADEGFYNPDTMIGITGRVVSPELYLAVALSGASQHMAGCSGSKNIVAINRDGDANIFKDSRFGVVGDYKQVLPAFVEEVRKLLAG